MHDTQRVWDRSILFIRTQQIHDLSTAMPLDRQCKNGHLHFCNTTKIGYCRVSTDDQNPDLQLTALKRAGCTRIFTDKATGAHVKRPELEKCLQTLNAG